MRNSGVGWSLAANLGAMLCVTTARTAGAQGISCSRAARPAAPAFETISIRGQPQRLRVYGPRGCPVAVVASGDGGWTHLGPYVAEFLSTKGYFVIGLDSKAYLSSFTRDGRRLSTSEVPSDFGVVLDYASQGSSPPLLFGISEGAALAVLAAASPALKAKVAGVVGLGLPEQGELGWRFRDSIIYLSKGTPKEPLFDTTDFIGNLAPVPIAAIHSSNDEFVSLDEIQRVMDHAGEPKRLWVIEAQNHRFSGNEQAFNERLLEAIAWIQMQRR